MRGYAETSKKPKRKPREPSEDAESGRVVRAEMKAAGHPPAKKKRKPRAEARLKPGVEWCPACGPGHCTPSCPEREWRYPAKKPALDHSGKPFLTHEEENIKRANALEAVRGALWRRVTTATDKFDDRGLAVDIAAALRSAGIPAPSDLEVSHVSTQDDAGGASGAMQSATSTKPAGARARTAEEPPAAGVEAGIEKLVAGGPLPPAFTINGEVLPALESAQTALIMASCQYVDRYANGAGDTADGKHWRELIRARQSVAAWFKSHVGTTLPKRCRVLGIDPGYANVGAMIVDFSDESLRCAHREKFTTSPADGDALTRLAMVARWLHALFARFQPDVIAYESVTHVGQAMGETNADAVHMLEVLGMIRMCGQLYAARPTYAIATATARKAIFGVTPRGTTRTKDDVKKRIEELLGVRKLNQELGDAGAVAFGGFARYIEEIRNGKP